MTRRRGAAGQVTLVVALVVVVVVLAVIYAGMPPRRAGVPPSTGYDGPQEPAQVEPADPW